MALEAYEIDISSSRDSYFKYIYRQNRGENKKSADGLYTGKVSIKNQDVSFIIVLELEGRGTCFDDAVEQCEYTIEHFCKGLQDFNLEDDGNRHHRNSDHYPVNNDHYIIALVVGSDNSRKSRKKPFYYLNGKRVFRYCYSSRCPADDTAEELIKKLDESYNITGNASRNLRNRRL